LCVFLEPLDNCVPDISSSLREISWIRAVSLVEINAMSTIFTFDVPGLHLGLLGWVMDGGHTGELPRILTRCQEVDVLSSDLKTTKIVVRELDSWRSHLWRVDSLAVVNPEVRVESV